MENEITINPGKDKNNAIPIDTSIKQEQDENTEINSVSYMEEMPKTFKYYMLKTKWNFIIYI